MLKKVGCCQCERHSMPEFFEVENLDKERYTNVGFNDNKHVLVQTTISAVQDVTLMIVLELLHGQYYAQFEELANVGEISVFTPNRALGSTRFSFLALLELDDMIGTIWSCLSTFPSSLSADPARRALIATLTTSSCSRIRS